MTEQEKQAIRERLERTTKGTWHSSNTIVFAFHEDIIGSKTIANWMDKNDAEFLAHAKTDIPLLLEEIEGNMEALQGWYDDYEELREENQRLQKENKRIKTDWEQDVMDGYKKYNELRKAIEEMESNHQKHENPIKV